MSMTNWAKHEIELACKYENPDWDGESFDYGCACYQSALKAFESLMSDEHSGASFGFTKSILIRLMDELPLTPITDEDFKEAALCCERNGVVSTQCPRMSSLFRDRDADGSIKYSDINRQYCIDTCNDTTYHCRRVSDIIDEMFPITLPYYPTTKKYKVYVESFLVNPANGDYDTQGVLYCITPKGERVEINRFFAEKDGEEMVEITKEEYEERKNNKLC